MNELKLWNLAVKELFELFKASQKGLNSEEAKIRLKKYGLNIISKNKKINPLTIFLNQFKNPLLGLIAFANLVAFFTGEKIESLIIFIILIVDALIGFFQEFKAQRTFYLLQKYIIPKATVLRDDQHVDIDAKEIVPGDIIYLQIGDIVPADARLINAKNLSVDESPLTGESIPSEKEVILDEMKTGKNPINAKHIVFTGTSIASGHGYAVVFATGMDTYFGKLTKYVEKEERRTTLFQEHMISFGTLLMKLTLIISIIILLINTFLGKGLLDSIIFSLALAIGITPELLPVIITVTLSQGALHMARKKVIIKKLISIENLGNMNLLCCDKTGTLTEGKFTLTNFINLDENDDERVLLLSALPFIFNHSHQASNLMDQAVADVIKNKNINYQNYKVIDKTEFDFIRRRTSYIVENDKERLLIVKGSPDTILKTCSHALINKENIEITKTVNEEIIKKINNYESNGYRVIAIAFKHTESNELKIEDEKELTLLGFLIFIDPPKITAQKSLQDINALNIDIKILTGDSPIITKKVCSSINFEIVENTIITGDMLENISKQDAEKYFLKYNVFARVTPEQKYEIIKFLKSRKKVIGYLGDGINDVPSLKAAEIGISVDSAVDIAREAADVILLKKSLRVLHDGIVEGRKAFGNTTKYILNTISANFGNMLTVAFWSIFLPFLPMQPSQILLTNLLTDISLLTISTDNIDPEFLLKPNAWNLILIKKFMFRFGLISSIFDSLLIAPLRFLFLVSKEQLQTSWFLFSVFSENLLTFILRTKKPFFKSRPSNSLIIIALITTIVAIKLPFTNIGKEYLDLTIIPKNIFMYLVIILFSYASVAEIAKLIFFKKIKLK